MPIDMSQLGCQLLRRTELSFGTQKVNEFQLELMEVYVALESQKVGLDGAGVALERGAETYVEHCRPCLSVNCCQSRVDSVGRNLHELTVGTQVGRGEPHLAAVLQTVNNSAAYGIAVTQHIIGCFDVTSHQLAAYARTAYGCSLIEICVGRYNFHTYFITYAAVIIGRQTGVVTKVVIVSNKQSAYAQSLLQEIRHERLRIKHGQGRCKVQREAVVYACLLQQAHLVIGGGQQARAVVGLQYLARMLGERYGHTPQAALCSDALELFKQMHMPQMDSVKESYRGCVTFVLRYGYGHLIVVWSAKVVKIRGQKEFFGSKLC